MIKKRIFIAAHYLEIGGAEISLIGLLNAIDYAKYDVDLFLYAHRGELMKYIPENVNLLPEIPEYTQIERPLMEVLKDRYWRQGFARIKAKIKNKIWEKRNKIKNSQSIFEFIDKAIVPALPSLYYLGEYDLAVNFIALKGHIPTKVKAKKTITWIHTDLSAININANLEFEGWNKYDYIASISPDVTKSFLKYFPSLSHKILEIENILSPDFIKKRSEEEEIKLEGSPKLLSVGRFCYAKNYDNVPDIARRLVEKGLTDLKWYLIGFGGDEDLIRQKISEAGMEDHVIILGKKENPYPYIKACDIYVQPSRFEGKSITVQEAQILCKPVVITNYPTASSQIEDGVDGVIVPMENKECANSIYNFINNQKLRLSIIRNLEKNEFEKVEEISKLYKLID